MKKSSIGIALLVFVLAGCSAKNAPEPTVLEALDPKEDFNSYWYGGKAELAHYDLEQARYGEIHKGEAVFIFVTEDFLLNEQVKFEHGDGEHVSVLKLNAIRRFKTGIYDYSLMRSVFTPVSDDRYLSTLKVSHSAQDWCGHSFTQINLNKDQYKLQQFSYFQDEGDRSFSYPVTMLEDEIWTRIRLGDDIPLGKQHIVPALDHIRMKHKEPKAYEASIDRSSKDGKTTTIVSYTQLHRTLTILSEEAFPYRILEWQEAIRDGGRELVTKAKLTNIRKGPYWAEHSNEHAGLRKELGLQW